VIAIPDAFRRATLDREGARGSAWLAALPNIAGELLERWDCFPDGPVGHGGVAIIVPVRRSAGPAVLKVSFPHPGNIHEPDAFVTWAGRGAVLLYERDDERFAMLLERAGATLLDVADGDEAAATAGRLSCRLAVPAPPSLPRLREDAGLWEEQLRKDSEQFPHALSDSAVGAALATARELAPCQPDLLVHGDFHATNILRGKREPWLVVDPKGYAGDPAYDAGMVIKWRPLRTLQASELGHTVRRMLNVFADAAELDPERARRWAQFHAVRAAFWGRRHGYQAAHHGPQADKLTGFAEEVAELLT
jgi:streptomycin 6-kinase